MINLIEMAIALALNVPSNCPVPQIIDFSEAPYSDATVYFLNQAYTPAGCAAHYGKTKPCILYIFRDEFERIQIGCTQTTSTGT